MPFSHLKRNKDSVISVLYQDPSGSLITKKDLKIIVPARYEESDFLTIGTTVYTLGIFCLVVGDNYAVNNLPSRVGLKPTEVDKVKYNDEEYYVFSFDAGSEVCENINVIKDETLGYYIYNYFIALCKIPWFMSSMDMVNLFKPIAEYTGKRYDDTILEMIISMIMRSPNDPHVYWRQDLNNDVSKFNTIPDWVPLRNIAYGARNTTAKLIGSYFDEGLNSALLNKSTETESIEELLRQ